MHVRDLSLRCPALSGPVRPLAAICVLFVSWFRAGIDTEGARSTDFAVNGGARHRPTECDLSQPPNSRTYGPVVRITHPDLLSWTAEKLEAAQCLIDLVPA